MRQRWRTTPLAYLLVVMTGAALAAPQPATAPATRPGDADNFEPKRVTIDADGVPAAKVYEQISQAAGTPLPLYPQNLFERLGDPVVTLHLKNVPLLEALIQLCTASGAKLTDSGEGLALSLNNDFRLQGRIVTAGPFLLCLNTSRTNATVALGEPDVHETVTQLGCALMSEPGLKVVQVGPPVDVVALDDRGAVVPWIGLPSDTAGRRQINVGLRQFDISLRTTPGLERLSSVAGVAPVTVLDGTVPFAITDVLAPGEKSLLAHGANVTVAEATGEGRSYKVVVKLTRGTMEAEVFKIFSQGVPPVQPRMKAEAAGTGNVYVSQRTNSEDEATLTLTLITPQPVNQARPVVTIEWPVPRAVRELRAHFEFKDVPLP